jgi:glycerol-3-phosphate O-acyltransferase/dihydroxyacetone phosphate acyltransferase
VAARLIRFLILRLVRLFYPRIEVRGREHLPASGPVIFVLNHPNGLLDPMLLIIATGRLVRFLAKSTFFGNPLGRMLMGAFGVLPVYRQRDEGQAGGPQGDAADRNEETFARCRELLRRGEALALFPEGTTHSGSTLLPLRTGAARIALSAEAEAGWKLGLQVVPVGLWYQSKTLFRTAALVVIGPSFDLADFAPAYAADPRQAVKQLTDQIDVRLDTVVLQAENAELLNGLQVVASWTAPEEPETLEEHHARVGALLAAYQRLREANPARLEQIEQQARRYARVLRTLGIGDPWSLELPEAHRRRIGWLIFALVVCFPLAAVGAALSYGPYRLAAPLAPRAVGPHDEVISTGKLILGSVLVFIGWLVEAIVVGALSGALWGLLLFVAAPALAYIALLWGETWRELREVAAYHWLRLRHSALTRELIARRQALASEVMDAVRSVQGDKMTR